jgi:hypothetical protein
MVFLSEVFLPRSQLRLLFGTNISGEYSDQRRQVLSHHVEQEGEVFGRLIIATRKSNFRPSFDREAFHGSGLKFPGCLSATK